MSQSNLQKQFKWSQNKLKRFLNLLQKEGMLTFETNELTTIISICNYDKYQVSERADERPDGRADERSTDEQANDKQECKEEKEGKKKTKPVPIDRLDFSEWPELPTQEFLAHWQQARKQKRLGKVTQRVIDLIAPDLQAAVSNGFEMSEVYRTWEKRGWAGFEYAWLQSSQGSKSANTTQPYQAPQLKRLGS